MWWCCCLTARSQDTGERTRSAPALRDAAGETIAADESLVDGSAAIDMSAMTRRLPVRAYPAASVVGGTVVMGGRLVIEYTAKDTRSPILLG